MKQKEQKSKGNPSHNTYGPKKNGKTFRMNKQRQGKLHINFTFDLPY